MSFDRVICGCFNVSEKTIVEHFKKAGATLDSLVEQTSISTSCASCRMDLDLVIAAHQQRAPIEHASKPRATANKSHWLEIPDDQTNCGFFVNRGGIETTLRVANHPLLYGSDEPVPNYRWSLHVFGPDGRCVYREKGRLGQSEELERSFATIQDCPPHGWFLVSLYPEARGLLGTVRPQIGYAGPRWVATVHTQLAQMSFHRRSVMVHTLDARLQATVSVVNPFPTDGSLIIELFSTVGNYAEVINVPIPGSNSLLLDLDSYFDGLPEAEPLLLIVSSDVPVARQIIDLHGDGSWSVDHFPNTQ
jgi:bacterioferritin-associated ferredoxin